MGFLLGEKIVLNEFVAYLDLRQMMNDNALSERAIVISTYALCGFANFASVAVPDRPALGPSCPRGEMIYLVWGSVPLLGEPWPVL